MNEETTRKRKGKLEELAPEIQAGVLEVAAHSRLMDALEGLRKHGVEVDLSTLSRFVKKHRQKNLLKDGETLKEGVDALAERARDGKFRAGSLEAVRQQLYEQALEWRTPEEALAMYAAMVKEETRLKELELEARKVAALEQQVKLQGVRIQIQARQKGVVGAEVVDSGPVALGAVGSGAVGEKGLALAQRQDACAEAGDVKALEERAGQEGLVAIALLREVEGIVNGAGMADEKVLAVRKRLAEGREEGRH